jgi:uncharacterized protein (TIGR00304 family)
MPEGVFLIAFGVMLIFIGFLLVFLDIMISLQEDAGPEEGSFQRREIREKKVGGGGVILIGPVPVVFGTDKKFALTAIILAIVLMLLAILFMLLMKEGAQ